MKKFISTLCLCFALFAQAQTDHLVISQVYGAGGNIGAIYTHDFVELYNPTATAISLTGWSLQYAGATGSNWNSNKVNLSGAVAPGKYFLIQLDGGTEGKPLPQPDFSSTAIVMSAAGGKVALVNNTTLLSGTGCPIGSSVVDFVAYKGSSSTPNCSETAPMVTPTNYSNSISRVNNGCTDNNNNSTDFVLTTPSPRNSSSSGHTCNGTSILINTVTPNPFCVDAANNATGTITYSASGTFNNSTFKAILSDTAGSFGFPVTVGSTVVSGTNPSGSINITIPAATASGTRYRIRIEATNPPLLSSQSTAFEIINGAKNILQNQFKPAANNTTIKLNWTNPTGCFDELLIVAKEGTSINGTPSGDGSAYTADLDFNGSGTQFDGGKVVYKGTASGQTVTNLINGTTYYFRIYTRRGTTWSSGTEISENPRVVPLPGEIVINQVSPDYSTASDEYIELVNLTDKPFDLSDVTIRVSNEVGNNGVAGGTLSGIIPPHGFWLLLSKKNPPVTSITVGKTQSLMADGSIDAGISATKNQIALIRKTDDTILDAVGFGAITNPVYTESASTSNPPVDGGLKRIISGTDNNNNRTDFTGVENAAIELRNSSSRLANAGAAIAAGAYTTIEVTGNASLSGTATLSNKIVLTNGIFSLKDHNLSTVTTTSATASKYIKTSGTGRLTITNITTDAFFPIGNSTYNPVTVNGGSGLDWSATVSDVIAPNPTPFEKETAVQRVWNITPSATPPSGATVVFEYNDADAAQVGSRFDKEKEVQVWNYHSGNWQSVTGPQLPVATASGRKAVTLNNYTRFSPFVIANVFTALPVRFVNFSARAQAGGIGLHFTNVSEKDVAHYIIERSLNGSDFETVVQLAPKNNNGSAATYRWLDAAPPAGEAWYRVKGVDEDGTTIYTPVLKIAAARTIKALTIYPNPVQGRSIIWQATLPKGTYQLRLNNSAGQAVLLQTAAYSGGNYTETLHLPAALQAGVYRLQISSGAFVRQQTVVVL